jgi:hypothetical protein
MEFHMEFHLEFASANPSVVRSVKQRDLLNAWLRARTRPRPRPLPSVRDYRPDRIADEMADMMGFDVTGNGEDARFLITQEGARLAATYGNEHIEPAKRTNRYLDDAIDPVQYARVRPCYQVCLTRKRPIYSICMVRDADGKEVSFERLLLPFGSADRVEQILGSYKAISIEGGFKITNLMATTSNTAPVSLVSAIIDIDFVRGLAVRGASDDVIEI